MTSYFSGTQSEKLEQLHQLHSELHQESQNLLKKVTEKLIAPWKAAGGCQACLGHKEVVTWSTLDGPGYTEYGPCKACTPASDLAGKMPGSYWAGGYYGAKAGEVTIEHLFSLPEFHTEAVLLNTYKLQLEATAFAIKEEEVRLTVERGKKVVVIKGRKVPKGTKGECFWTGYLDTRFGRQERAGFTTESGETVWIAKANLAVLEA